MAVCTGFLLLNLGTSGGILNILFRIRRSIACPREMKGPDDGGGL
jgi:hypothetical protein